MDRETNDLTHTIIGCAYTVSNALGIGFLEKVYENATAHEVRKSGLSVVQQHPIDVIYDNLVVGQYFADLLIENHVLVEVKVTRDLTDVHAAQCLNYLRATGMPVCLLINFGRPKVQIKRILPHNDWNEINN
ncbi:MAG: GxxExxY protein [Anaerolineales bacterium]|nr:GxxExxY protein [Chloroflexota bacterium]MBL6982597.1 GxxExxY protein [Anaerolineales bacterium]